jgi:hypothetical protein
LEARARLAAIAGTSPTAAAPGEQKKDGDRGQDEYSDCRPCHEPISQQGNLKPDPTNSLNYLPSKGITGGQDKGDNALDSIIL